MCQVHSGAYVSLLAPGKTDYNRLPPRKDYHVYITRSTYHYAYARQTQVKLKKEKKTLHGLSDQDLVIMTTLLQYTILLCLQ